MLRLVLFVPALFLTTTVGFPAAGQEIPTVITGRVHVAASDVGLAGAIVTVEGSALRAVTDTAGMYRLAGVAPGPQVLLVRRIGYAPVRIPLAVPASGTVRQDVAMAATALELPGIIVTADPTGRAEGELGTASVIDREAIANQSATSLRGVLELLPGVPLQPPGLDGVEQIALRSVPTGTSGSFTAGGPSGADLASFGTLIVLDGVPVSNNANLQTTGPRGELQSRLPVSAGGGVDLRRFPASTIERVEVIRGVPSARYGDLTQGVIIVNTRAGVVEPEVLGRYDERTAEASLVLGPPLGNTHTVTGAMDVTRTLLAPGLSDDDSYRFTAQLMHRAALGRAGPADDPSLTFDTQAGFFFVREENPEQPEIIPGRASFNRDRGLRLSERIRLALGAQGRLTLTSALDYVRQRSFTQALVVRGATPFTERLTEGRATGHYVLGQYLAQVNLAGDAWHLYNRLEAQGFARALGMGHRLVAGAELRREWNDGAGFQFDIEFPPQVTFNGVQGFDRPRAFSAIPPVATTAVYLDDRVSATVAGIGTDLQLGLRMDLLHDGGWFGGVRDAVVQPRANLQFAPASWLRLRAGAGRTAKQPSLAQLYPAPQYFDVVNVNWFTPDPDERLAVLTTFIRDPSNPDLGFATGRKLEAGMEIGGGRGPSVSLVAFSDRVSGGVGFRQEPGFLVRDLFDLADSTTGTGVPPTIIEPATRADTVPILVDRPANVLTLDNEGLELTATLPQIRPLRLQINVTGALLRTRFFSDAIDFGRIFRDFQVNSSIPRSPYWESVERRGERGILTWRLVHHQPDLGLVVTAVVEHFFHDVDEVVGGTDTLAFAGYVTRAGELVPVPPERRADPEFADLRIGRIGFSAGRDETPADWLASLELRKSLPFDGHLSFFAFNVFDRLGRFVADARFSRRTFPSVRFGIEVTMPLGPLWPGAAW